MHKKFSCSTVTMKFVPRNEDPGKNRLVQLMVFLFIPSLSPSVGGISFLVSNTPFSATSAVVGQLVGHVVVAWSADSHR